MKKLILVMVSLLTFLLIYFTTAVAYEKGIKDISSSVAEGVVKSGKKTVAVVDFTDLQGNVTELGRFIAEELSVDLTITAKGFEVIDRTHLGSILKEHKLSISGLVNPKTVKKLGQIAGVDAIITGSITPFGDSIRVSTKVIATDTARVIAAAKGGIAKTKAIEELLARGIEPGTQAGTPTPAPTKQETKVGAKIELQEAEAENFSFVLKECKLSGQAVTCYLDVMNKADKVRPFTIGARDSMLYDDLGDEHKGNHSTLITKGGKSSTILNLIPQVPVSATLKFDGVSPQASKAVILKIGYYSGWPSPYTIQFRNIPLSR